MRGAVAEAKGRAKRERTVVQSHTQTRRGRNGQEPNQLRSGVLLVRLSDQKACQKAQRMRFQVTSDPVVFVAQIARIPRAQRKGHVVLAPLTSIALSVCGGIAAALMGCFQTTPEDFLSLSPRGATYRESYSDPAHAFRVDVSARLAEEVPALPGLLRAIAHAPGSRVQFYFSEKKLKKFFKEGAKN